VGQICVQILRCPENPRARPVYTQVLTMNAASNPLYFLIAFPLFWFVVTMILSFISGWFGLAERYPDVNEEPVLILRNQSGSVGSVSMRGILQLSVCPSGLRIGIMRLFGPFSRAFFVPWNEISVTRSDRFLWKEAKLSFGQPSNGNLKVFAELADRMARAAGSNWPEQGSFPEESGSQAFARIAKLWVAMTSLAAAFFIIVPRLATSNAAARPPIVVAILFPATVFGIGAAIRYFRQRRP
jgi:hypothetical protein